MSSNYSKQELTYLIKKKAYDLGFTACGIAKAEPIENKQLTFYQEWLRKGYHAEMLYLNNYFDKRMNPELLVPGTRSIISVAYNYYPNKFLDKEEYQIAWYAYGKDYHFILKEKLDLLFKYIQSIISIEGRFFCDTAPVLDRYWAWKAGLGWIGKNTQLIIPNAGSTFFLGELFIDLELNYDQPQRNRCGNCTRCLTACPTKALEAPYTLNSNLCISYQTIENKGDINNKIIPYLKNKIYGCDDCLKACPWTRFAQPTTEQNFLPSDSLLAMTKDKWLNLTELEYQNLFKKSAVKRAKFTGLKRNINALNQND